MNHTVLEETYEVRPMREEDTPAMADLHRRAVLEAYLSHYSPEVVADWANSRAPERYLKAQAKGEQFLVYVRDRKVLGFISWHNGELCAMYVDPDYQKQGIGALLATAARFQAAHEGKPLVRVKAALPAQGFYEKIGFVFINYGTSTVQGHTVRDVVMEYPEAE